MRISELTPDKTLAYALDHVLTVQTSASKSRTVKVYRGSEMPNKVLADEFITVANNGVIRSITFPIGVFKGGLAITLYCKANSNGTAKLNRINSLLAQLQTHVENSTFGDFHYRLSPDSIITPTRVNSTTGYATTVVNVMWHTT